MRGWSEHWPGGPGEHGFLETTLLFLHILGAMATMGGVRGLIIAYGRARAAALIWLSLLLVVAIVSLMVFQPLVFD